MERLTSDDLHPEKTTSSSYYSCTKRALNGYMNIAAVPPSSATTDETSDAELERVGVFDYVLSSPHNRENNCSSVPLTSVGAAVGSGSSTCLQKWAQDMNSPAKGPCSDSGTELTTFCCTSSDVHSQLINDDSCVYGNDDSKADVGSCSELEEVVVHSEIQSQRASYERFNPDFMYPGICRSSSVYEPATVFLMSSNKSRAQDDSIAAIDTSDKRDVTERRSPQACKCASLLRLWLVVNGLQCKIPCIYSMSQKLPIVFCSMSVKCQPCLLYTSDAADE